MVLHDHWIQDSFISGIFETGKYMGLFQSELYVFLTVLTEKILRFYYWKCFRTHLCLTLRAKLSFYNRSKEVWSRKEYHRGTDLPYDYTMFFFRKTHSRFLDQKRISLFFTTILKLKSTRRIDSFDSVILTPGSSSVPKSTDGPSELLEASWCHARHVI